MENYKKWQQPIIIIYIYFLEIIKSRVLVSLKRLVHLHTQKNWFGRILHAECLEINENANNTTINKKR
jgi:hypothetical protein